MRKLTCGTGRGYVHDESAAVLQSGLAPGSALACSGTRSEPPSRACPSRRDGAHVSTFRSGRRGPRRHLPRRLERLATVVNDAPQVTGRDPVADRTVRERIDCTSDHRDRDEHPPAPFNTHRLRTWIAHQMESGAPLTVPGWVRADVQFEMLPNTRVPDPHGRGDASVRGAGRDRGDSAARTAHETEQRATT